MLIKYFLFAALAIQQSVWHPWPTQRDCDEVFKEMQDQYTRIARDQQWTGEQIQEFFGKQQNGYIDCKAAQEDE